MRPQALVPVVLLAASFDGTVHAESHRQWIGVTNADSVALLYGTPQTDDIAISFTCDRTRKTIKVSYAYEPAGAKSGMHTDVELSSEGGKLLLSATGRRLEMDDAFVLDATTKADAGLRRLLAEGRTLSIRVQENVQAYPLDGAAKAAGANLIAACS